MNYSERQDRQSDDGLGGSSHAGLKRAQDCSLKAWEHLATIFYFLARWRQAIPCLACLEQYSRFTRSRCTLGGRTSC